MSRTDTAVRVISASPDRVFAALTDSDAHLASTACTCALSEERSWTILCRWRTSSRTSACGARNQDFAGCRVAWVRHPMPPDVVPDTDMKSVP
jgi:hypothetical protein